MASGAQMVVMLAIILLVAMADSHSQPQPEGTCSVGFACAERCSRLHPIVDSDPPFKISPVCTHRTEHELYAHLYLHHIGLGNNKNQHGVLDAKLDNEFGDIVVNDWLVTDGPSRGSKVVAHAKGVHIQAGMSSMNYYVSFNMVFEAGSRFKGSTLQIMGTVVERGEWAIVGGTGEFTLARGVIYKTKAISVRDEGDIIELDIRCLYTPMERSKGTSWTIQA